MGTKSCFATNYSAKRVVSGACGGTTGNIKCTTQTLTAAPSPNYVSSIVAQYNNNTDMYGYRLSMLSGLPNSGTATVSIMDAYQNTYIWNNAIISMGNVLLTTSPDTVVSYNLLSTPATIIDSTNNSIYAGIYKFSIQNYSTTYSTFSFGNASNGVQSIQFVADY